MEPLTEREPLPSSETKLEGLKRRMVLLKKIELQVLKKEKTLWEEWRTLTREDRGRRR